MSANGTLAYVRGSGAGRGTPVIVDRNGVLVRRLSDTPLDRPRHPALDPRGERLALVVGPPDNSRVWFYFLDGRPPIPALSSENPQTLAWSPSSDRLAVGCPHEGLRFVCLIETSRLGGTPQPFFSGPSDIFPQDWSSDGQEIVVTVWNEGRHQTDVLAVSAQDSEKVRVLAGAPEVNEYHARLSPNGRWLAYGVWDRRGPLEIHVRPYAGEGDAVRLIAALGATSGIPTLSASRTSITTWTRTVRFILIETEAETAPNTIVVALNWDQELKRVVPTR